VIKLTYSACNDYEQFLKTKLQVTPNKGFNPDSLNSYLFDFQKDIVRWALKKGKAALFEDTGLGKTIQQLAWAEAVCKHTDGDVLILAPLAVSKQTEKEAAKFGIQCHLCECQDDVMPGINITNYEKMHKFDADSFIGIVLDESSIIKNYSGKTTMEFIDLFARTKYKLCCTATPSPNDYTEIGTTSEFLGIMPRSEMLSTYFINDCMQGDGWRLKRHAINDFFRWMTTWSMMIKTPNDLGYDGSRFNLPGLNIKPIIIPSEPDDEHLIPVYAETLTDRRKARKESLNERVQRAVKLAQGDEQCLIWCDYNYESEALHEAIEGSVEVKGSDQPEHKENAMIGFTDGTVKTLISKPSICGFGMNWQNCHKMIFCGLSDSFEQFYQAIRRCYRFGQMNQVNVYIIISENEMNVLDNVRDKQNRHETMTKRMIAIMSESEKSEIEDRQYIPTSYSADKKMEVPKWL
jgi:superfamily II DNA or RNA helicase